MLKGIFVPDMANIATHTHKNIRAEIVLSYKKEKRITPKEMMMSAARGMSFQPQSNTVNRVLVSLRQGIKLPDIRLANQILTSEIRKGGGMQDDFSLAYNQHHNFLLDAPESTSANAIVSKFLNWVDGQTTTKE